MIRTEREYQESRHRREQGQEVFAAQRRALELRGISPDDVELALEPMRSLYQQIADEIAWYERTRQRDFDPIARFTEIGGLLIALRIGSGMTQRELAQRLGVAESQVSRDERHEYYGITLVRAQRVLDVLLSDLDLEFMGQVHACEHPVTEHHASSAIAPSIAAPMDDLDGVA